MLQRINPQKHVYQVYRKDTPDDRRIVYRVLLIKARASNNVTQLCKDHTHRKNSTTHVRDRVDSDGSNYSSSDDEFLMMDDSVVSVPSPARLRRSTRVIVGKHSKNHRLPKTSVCH